MNPQEEYYYQAREARKEKEELERLKKYIFPCAFKLLEQIKSQN